MPPKEAEGDLIPSLDMAIIDMTDYAGGRFLNKFVYKISSHIAGGTQANRKMAASMAISTPIRSMIMMSAGGATLQMGKDIVRMGTGHFCSGFFKLIFHSIIRTKKANDD